MHTMAAQTRRRHSGAGVRLATRRKLCFGCHGNGFWCGFSLLSNRRIFRFVARLARNTNAKKLVVKKVINFFNFLIFKINYFLKWFFFFKKKTKLISLNKNYTHIFKKLMLLATLGSLIIIFRFQLFIHILLLLFLL